jgi:hypothetical protein
MQKMDGKPVPAELQEKKEAASSGRMKRPPSLCIASFEWMMPHLVIPAGRKQNRVHPGSSHRSPGSGLLLSVASGIF